MRACVRRVRVCSVHTMHVQSLCVSVCIRVYSVFSKKKTYPFMCTVVCVLVLILLAFITGKSSLEPLLEGVFVEIHIDLS